MIQFSQENGSRLIVYLFGEIDHHSAQSLRIQIESMIHRTQAKHLTLDFSNVSFMDSSGVGMIIGRYRTMSSAGGLMSARGLHSTVERLFRMAGLHRIIAIEEIQEEKRA